MKKILIQNLKPSQVQSIVQYLKAHGVGINDAGVHDNFLYLHRDLVSHGKVFMIDEVHITKRGDRYLAKYQSSDVADNDWSSIHFQLTNETIEDAALQLFQKINNYRINELYGKS